MENPNNNQEQTLSESRKTRLKGRHGEIQYRIEDLAKKDARTPEEDTELEALQKEQAEITLEILKDTQKGFEQ